MTSLARINLNWHSFVNTTVFKKTLLLYLVFYSLVEIPYLEMMYGTPLDISSRGDTLLTLLFLKIKSSSVLIYGLHFLKICFVSLALTLQNQKIARPFMCGFLFIAAIFILIGHNSSPELRYLNFALFSLMLFPNAFKNLTQNESRDERYLRHTLWFVFGLSYSISGFFKFNTPEWYAGEFMKQYILTNHTFNPTFSFLILLPDFVLKMMTYFPLFTELLALPMCMIPRLRLPILLFLTLMQFSLLLIADIPQITIGMLIFHFFMLVTISKPLTKPDEPG